MPQQSKSHIKNEKQRELKLFCKPDSTDLKNLNN